MANPSRFHSPLTPRPLPHLLVALLGFTLLPQPPLDAAPVLSEFMASNAARLDEDREPSDWIRNPRPRPRPVNLAGWFLTDDPTQPTLWRFPDRTCPPAVTWWYSPPEDRTGAVPAPLHTNFRLGASGDYLALIQPDGLTIATAFAPSFPQEPDFSYGTPVSAGPRDLLAAGRVSVLIPTNAAMLQASWNQPELTPNSDWKFSHQPAARLRRHPSHAANTNLARSGKASQSTEGFGFPADLAIDGDPDSFTHTAGDDDNSTWSVDLSRVYELSRIVLRNRTSCSRPASGT